MKLIKNNYILLSILLLSFLGFLDATYLTILHYKNAIPPCSLAHGCDKVLTSSFSTINGVPIALIGSVFYLLLIILLVSLIEKVRKSIVRAVFIMASVGTLASFFLIYIQFAVIHALCQYCLASEAITFLIFIMGIYLLRVYK
ncbi:MAG: vitamin K epoxide reductase family protein [Patescibacteria group bacterium]|nr:vitamin K epoxide reductase family protein [Patescibacteria group bacterium]